MTRPRSPPTRCICSTMGGFTHTFRRKDWEWDVGLHYVGEFHTNGTDANLLMHDISEGRLEWAPLPARYDRFVFPDRQYDFVAGRRQFVDELSIAFPDERDAITRYVELCDQVYLAGMKNFQAKALPRFPGRLCPRRRRLRMRRRMRRRLERQ